MLLPEETHRDTFAMSLGHPPCGIAHIDELRKAVDAEDILHQAKQNAIDIQEDMMSVDYSEHGDRADFIQEQVKADKQIMQLKKSVTFKQTHDDFEPVYQAAESET